MLVPVRERPRCCTLRTRRPRRGAVLPPPGCVRARAYSVCVLHNAGGPAESARGIKAASALSEEDASVDTIMAKLAKLEAGQDLVQDLVQAQLAFLRPSVAASKLKTEHFSRFQVSVKPRLVDVIGATEMSTDLCQVYSEVFACECVPITFTWSLRCLRCAIQHVQAIICYTHFCAAVDARVQVVPEEVAQHGADGVQAITSDILEHLVQHKALHLAIGCEAGFHVESPVLTHGKQDKVALRAEDFLAFSQCRSSPNLEDFTLPVPVLAGWEDKGLRTAFNANEKAEALAGFKGFVDANVVHIGQCQRFAGLLIGVKAQQTEPASGGDDGQARRRRTSQQASGSTDHCPDIPEGASAAVSDNGACAAAGGGGLVTQSDSARVHGSAQATANAKTGWQQGNRRWLCQPFLFFRDSSGVARFWTCQATDTQDEVARCIDWWLGEAQAQQLRFVKAEKLLALRANAAADTVDIADSASQISDGGDGIEDASVHLAGVPAASRADGHNKENCCSDAVAWSKQMEQRMATRDPPLLMGVVIQNFLALRTTGVYSR